MYWNIYTVPIIFSAIVLLILYFLLLNIKKSKGALLFSHVVLCFFVYTLGYALVISSEQLDVAEKFFLIERIGASLIPSFYLIFAVSFIEKYNLLKKSIVPLYFVIPILSFIFLITNSYHNLFYSNPIIDQGTFYIAFTYSPEIWYYIQQSYILIGSLIVNIILITLFLAGSSIYRKQIGTIVIGSLSLLIIHTLLNPNLLGMFDIKLNTTPFLSSFAGIIIYIGLRRYSLFKYVPIVRDTLFEKMADAVIVLDKESKLVDLNQTATRYLNIGRKDIGINAEHVLSFWNKLRCRDADVNLRSDYEYRTVVYDIDAFFQINISPYYDKSNSFQGQIIVMRDITAQKDAEKVLDSQTRLLNTMLDNLPIGIFMVEANTGKPLIANHRAKELLGRGILPDVNKDNLGEVYRAYIAGTDITYPAEEMPILRGMQGESSLVSDMEVKRPDGTRISLEIYGCPVLDSKGKVFASLVGFMDITNRKKAEQRIHAQNRELQDLNATKDKFFSIIAHDLKNPLNAILGFSELLHKDIDNLERDEIIDFSSVIYNSTLQTSKLLQNLLEWSRVKRGIFEYFPKEENLLDIIKESIEPLLSSATNKSIDIKFHQQNGITIFADRQMISSVIRNLVTNAIKFTPKNGKVEINSIANDNQVKITVTDNGIGMDRGILESLFRIDAKVNRAGTEGEASTGLGLLLCKEFVEKHNGKIWATSEVGKGSTFCFSLPVGGNFNDEAEKAKLTL